MKTKKLIIDDREKKYLLKEGVREFGNDLGVIKLDNAKLGSTIKSHKGNEFYLVEPTLYDIIKKMKRSVTTLLPKDIGMIIAYAGIENGETVVEAGTGSGALTMYLANAVGKEGKVITYDVRADASKIARKNLEIVGAVKPNQKIIGVEEEEEEKEKEKEEITVNEKDNLYNVVQKIGNITEGIEEENIDVLVLDMPDPWNVVEHAKKSLNPAKGRIVTYVPYIEQAKKTVEALKEHEFLDILTVECIVRNMDISEKGVRPSTRMIGHTGYITVARVRPPTVEIDENNMKCQE